MRLAFNSKILRNVIDRRNRVGGPLPNCEQSVSLAFQIRPSIQGSPRPRCPGFGAVLQLVFAVSSEGDWPHVTCAATTRRRSFNTSVGGPPMARFTSGTVGGEGGNGRRRLRCPALDAQKVCNKSILKSASRSLAFCK